MTTDILEAAPITPDEAWIDAFTKQCTEELRLDAKEYAKRRTYGIGKAGAHVDAYTAEELVADALGDTLLGVLAWDPSAKSLYQHVEDAVRSRTRHERKRARRFQHHRIDAPATLHEQKTTLGEIDTSMRAERGDADTTSMMFAIQVIDQLREIAAGDPLVLRFLDAVIAGARGGADIMHTATLSAKQYRNARDRLRRLAEQLDTQTMIALRHA
ncbi:MAG: hypothetical protein WKG01_11405 [Kofleriaceae bacterium]